MKLKKINLVISLTVTLCFNSAIQAQDSKPANAERVSAKMESVKKASEPGPHHEILKQLVGEWTATTQFKMKPEDKFQSSTANSTIKMKMGDRFLKQKYEGQWMGQDYQGMGLVGYDNVRKEYNFIWLDNMSTGIYQSSGQFDPVTKTFKSSGTSSCPMTGEKNKEVRNEWQIIDQNKNIYRMYTKDAQGKEFKSMEIVYRRTPKKAD